MANKRRKRDKTNFDFTLPQKPVKRGSKTEDIGDKAKLREVVMYLEHNGKPLALCSMRLLHFLGDACGYTSGCCYYGEAALLDNARMSERSLKRARVELRGAMLLDWTDRHHAPMTVRETAWHFDGRTNFYIINWPMIREVYHALVELRAKAKEERDAQREKDRREAAMAAARRAKANAIANGKANAAQTRCQT